MEEGKSTFKILTESNSRKPRRIWEVNIRIDHIGIGVNKRYRIISAEDTVYWRVLVNATLNLRVT